MMLDEAGPRLRARLVEAERRRNRRGQTPYAGEIARARRHGAARPVAQEKPALSPQVRARIAGDGEEIDVGGRDAAEREARGERVVRKSGAMLDAPKALLFDRRHETAVADEDGGDVAVVGVEADDVHPASVMRLSFGQCRDAVVHERGEAVAESLRREVLQVTDAATSAHPIRFRSIAEQPDHGARQAAAIVGIDEQP